tara:strand:+ start:2932 stop:7605 length:4674 start_codon:yes stop_codon:yes gene_type:complete
MPCNGTYTCLTGQTYSCTGNQWSCNSGCGAGQTAADNCYWSDPGSGCDWDSCCTWYYPNQDGQMCAVTGPCTGSCPGGCHSCCGTSGDSCGDGYDFEPEDPPPCACYSYTTIQVTSGTGNPGNLGDCRFCWGTSGTVRCRNNCDNWCGSHYGTSYESQQCIDSDGNTRGDEGTVYPERSYSRCATNWCGSHNACSCDCLTPVTIDVEVVNGPFIGCTDAAACNHDPDALCDDASCDYGCYGCTNPGAVNYDSGATIDDGSCEYHEAECIDPAAINCDTQCLQCNEGGTYDCESQGNCEYPIVGCTDESAINYDPDATIACNGNNGSIPCSFETTAECTVGDGYTTTPCTYNDECNPTNNYIEEEAGMPCNPDCGPCGNFCTCIETSAGDGTNCCCEYEEGEEEKPIAGCSDPSALNYDSDVTYDNGSCIYDSDDYLCEGTTTCEDYYLVYNECPFQYGCEFIEGGDSEDREEGCMGSNISCFNDIFVNTLHCPTALGCEPHSDGGCTEPEAVNYDENALYDDGSCIYYPVGETNGNQVTWYCQIWTINNVDFYCRIDGYELPNYPWDIIISNPSTFVDGSQVDWSVYNNQFISITTTGDMTFNTDGFLQYFSQSDLWVSWELLSESVSGCTNQYAYNYDSGATLDDGSCLFFLTDYGENLRFKVNINVDSQFGTNFRADEFIYFKFPSFYHEHDINSNDTFEGDLVTESSTHQFGQQFKNKLFDLGSYYSPQYLYTILNSNSSSNKSSFLNKFYKTELGMEVKNQISNPNRLESDEWDDDDGTHSRNDCASLDYVPNIPIKITELMHSPRGITNEYLEITNTSNQTFDLSGWKFTRGIYFTFPEGTIIPGGERIVIGRPTPHPCSQEHPLMCQAQCLNDDGDDVQNGELGTCFYYDDFDVEVDHPRSGTTCSWEELCTEISYSYLNRPQADIFNNPDDYGALLGVNLFYWNIATQNEGNLINLADYGEDVLLEDSNGNNIDCVDYKGWTPDVSSPSYDMLNWPLVRAGIFGGNSIQKYENYLDDDNNYWWYAGRKFPNIFLGGGDATYDSGTPFEEGLDSPVDLGMQTYYNNYIDLTSEEAQATDSWMLEYWPDGEFLFSISMVTFMGQTNVCQNDSGDDYPCITGAWVSRVPGYGIYEITGTFTMTGWPGTDWLGDNPDSDTIYDDCGIEDGTNDCSNCNPEGGYQCDTCACSGCTDTEALNYGVWWYGDCEVDCTGSGNCNTLWNLCSGGPSIGSYCETDDDCVFTGYICDYPPGGPTGGLDCGGIGNQPNPDVFGQCIPEMYGGDGDGDCIILNDGVLPLVDDGSCQYQEPAGYVEGRIIQQDGGLGKVLQFRTIDNNMYSGGYSGTTDYGKLKANNHKGFKVEKVKGKLAKLISNAKSTSKKYNNGKGVAMYKDTPMTRTQIQDIRESRDSIFIAGVQLYAWSNRCFNNFFDVTSQDDWESVYQLVTTNNMNGGKFANIVSYYFNDGNINPIEITSEWTNVLFFGWVWNVYNSRNVDNCGQPGYPDCDTNYIVISDINGDLIECIMEDDSIQLPSSRCLSAGGGEMDLPPSPY